MSVLAPRLRQRINFQAQEEFRDSEGRLTITWVDAILETGEIMTEVPAEVLTGPGREFQQSGQLQAQITARITCRWFPGLKGSWRIVWDGQCYNIHTWETDVTARREYRIKCTSGVNDGQ